MTNTMDPNASGMTHNRTVKGLTQGSTYSYYVRCADNAGHANATDYLIQFKVEGQAIHVPIGPVNTQQS